jgi:hypothetical protein
MFGCHTTANNSFSVTEYMRTNYEILNLSGKDNFFADMFSRLPKENTGELNMLSA